MGKPQGRRGCVVIIIHTVHKQPPTAIAPRSVSAAFIFRQGRVTGQVHVSCRVLSPHPVLSEPELGRSRMVLAPACHTSGPPVPSRRSEVGETEEASESYGVSTRALLHPAPAGMGGGGVERRVLVLRPPASPQLPTNKCPPARSGDNSTRRVFIRRSQLLT